MTPKPPAESWLSRGDRRLSEVILKAWQNGARFDAWSDQFNMAHWRAAFTEVGLDPDFYSHRTRELDEILPWDHINAGVKKSFLKTDYQWSLQGKTRPDCRGGCYGCGILSAFNELRLVAPDGAGSAPKMSEQEQITRIRLKYAKGPSLRFTGHLDMQRLWERLLRRSGCPSVIRRASTPRQAHLAPLSPWA